MASVLRANAFVRLDSLGRLAKVIFQIYVLRIVLVEAYAKLVDSVNASNHGWENHVITSVHVLEIVRAMVSVSQFVVNAHAFLDGVQVTALFGEVVQTTVLEMVSVMMVSALARNYSMVKIVLKLKMCEMFASSWPKCSLAF